VIKAECSASLIQASVSHDPTEITLIWGFDAQETFIIIINVENSCVIFFSKCFEERTAKEQNNLSKELHLSEI